MADSTGDKASEIDPALHKKMLQLLSSLWVTRAIGAFARLGLADAMAEGTQEAATIATARGLLPDRVDRLLRALSTVGIVSESTRGRFALTPLGHLLTSRGRNNMRATAILLNDYLADMWNRLDDALADERTALLAAVLAAYPNRHGTLFDLAEAIAAARSGEGGPLPGVAFVVGDVLTSAAPAGGDLYLMRHLLHDYADADCVRILANVRRAMKAEARVLVMEAPLPADDSSGPGRWLDLQVMLLCGGRERTVDEYAALLARAGLRWAQTIPTRHPAMTVIEAVAAADHDV